MHETKEQRDKLKEAAASSKAFGEADGVMKDAIKTMEKKREELIRILVEKVKALPDNPRINRLGENCVTVKSGDLNNAPWTAFYHDFKAQYKKIIGLIETESHQELMVKIGTIIEKGVIHEKGICNSFHFHPDVRQSLKDLK